MHRIVAAVVVSAAAAGPVAAQVQYRSPAGVEYRAQPETDDIRKAAAASAAEPDNVDPLLALGLAQAGAQQYREAIATFSRAIDLAPERSILYRWRGHRYLSVRELARARADLERGLELDPRCYGCLYHLGIVRYLGGDFPEAAEIFTRAIPLAPDPGEYAGSVDWLWMSLSRARRTADAEAALARYAPAVTAENAYARRIQLYRGLIRPADLIGPADTAAVDVATRSYALGNWYLLAGDVPRAREWFQRSVASGGWAAFGFIASEAELRRLR